MTIADLLAVTGVTGTMPGTFVCELCGNESYGNAWRIADLVDATLQAKSPHPDA